MEPPVTLHVDHPRFESAEVRIEAGPGGDIRLTPRQEAYETVVVTASRQDGAVIATSASATTTSPGETIGSASTVTDVIAGVPGVAESGQGGAFQSIAVRGTSGQRLTTLVAGVPIALLAAGAVWTILRPERGPHDILARTWMVVR